jgi:hypothetical protein
MFAKHPSKKDINFQVLPLISEGFNSVDEISVNSFKSLRDTWENKGFLFDYMKKMHGNADY